ncbi:unnamed protein product [Thelazia callipaeda]|uniref:I-set domain-containing protein n=1 Tax=Thelazia callipaeda TaxID=103827 RepID=A0A0N5CTK6_THECL|nr:unnamed protein product [Thelazia callipaeda]
MRMWNMNTELVEEPFRWDQRSYSIVLRIMKLQQQGTVLHFEKYGSDPQPNIGRTNGTVENGNSKKNDELASLTTAKSSNTENWRTVTCTIYSRASSSGEYRIIQLLGNSYTKFLHGADETYSYELEKN